MNEAYLEKRYSNFIITLLLLFPILINSVKILGNFILLILFFLGLYIAITEKKNPFQIPELKLFSWLTTGYFLVMLLSILIADGFNAELYHLGRKIHFLFAPFIALAIFQVDFSLKKILLSIKVGLIAIGTVAITGPLLGSMINANIFSDIAVAMLFLSIVQIFSETQQERIVTFIAALMGGYAIYLTGARGSWVSFLILFIVFVGLTYKPFIHGNNKAGLFLVLLCVGLLGFVSTNDRVESRIKLAVGEIQNWNSGHNANDSVGLRLQMWRAGLNAAKESPWVGYGYRNANKVASKYAPNNKKTIENKTHLHNEYITSLVSAGVIGLLALTALLLLPLRIFLSGLKQDEKYFYSLMGVMLCVGYATFGFTHIIFGEEHINAFYILFMSFLLPRVVGGDNAL